MHSQQQSTSPFQYLLGLEEQFLAQSQSIPYHETKGADWLGVVFLSGEYVLLTPLIDVMEILPMRKLTPIPGVKPWLHGLTTSRGELFPVTDLSGFLTQKVTPATSHARILVVSHDEEYSGILVDRVLGIQRFFQKDKKNSLANTIVNDKYAPFIIGSFINNNIELPIISCKAIIQDPRFRDVVLKEDELMEQEE